MWAKGVVEAEIVEWRVAVGDVVDEDQSLVDVMTDKATVDIPSPVAGQVKRIHGEPGDVAAVGSVIIEIDAAVGGASDAPNEANTSAAAPAPRCYAGASSNPDSDPQRRRAASGRDATG